MSDRKYRQRGYQDSGQKERERSESSTSRPPAPRDDSRGPRGRGLGAPTETVFKCAACGTQLPPADEIAVEARCPRCGADLHTCSHCSHFDSAVFNECRQGGALPPGATTPVRVAKKTQRNDCTLFAPRGVQVFAKEEKRSPDDPRAAFDALFKI
jgi:predicted RNA-binding Zn-ribbon protein involved in translation (DUF1610 family)